MNFRIYTVCFLLLTVIMSVEGKFNRKKFAKYTLRSTGNGYARYQSVERMKVTKPSHHKELGILD